MATQMKQVSPTRYERGDGFLIIERESGRRMVDENNTELVTKDHWVLRNVMGEAFGVDWNLNDLAERHNIELIHG